MSDEFAPTEAHFQGCLVGQALGDALGFPVEGRPRAACDAYVRENLEAGRAGEKAAGSYPFGQYTDDTQLARELLASLTDARGAFDGDGFGRRVAAIFDESRIVGRGRTTEAAARRLAQGTPWHSAGTRPPAAGNGGAMRAAPIGLLYYDDLDALRQVADDQARVTHADPRARAGAVAIAGAVAFALRGEFQPGSEAVVGRLATLAEPVSEVFAIELDKLKAWVALTWEEAGPEIGRAGVEPGHPTCDGITPFVTSSVIWALYSVLRSPDDYWKTLCTAIRVGGDVDTTAAMAGAVSGALNGIEAVPANLAERLQDRGSWGAEALARLAGDAYLMKCGGN